MKGELPESLIDRIHTAPLSGGGWGSLVPILEEMLQGRVAIFETGARSLSTLAACSEVRPAAMRAYENGLWTQDRALLDLRSGSVGRIVSDSDIIGERENSRSEFYRSYLQAIDGRRGLYGTAFRHANSMFVISARRNERTGDFGGRERHMMGLVLPHLRRAFETWQAIRREREIQAGGLQAMKHAGAAMLIIDKSMRVRFASEVALQRLAETPILIARETLIGRSAVADSALRKAVKTVLSNTSQSSPTRVLLPASGSEAALSLSVAVLESSLPADPDAAGLAVVTFHGSEPMPFDRDAFRSHFGLTNAEARLLAALATGERLADYAAGAGITLTTAKSHLAAIFSKTGERRQVDLVRHVLTLGRAGALLSAGA